MPTIKEKQKAVNTPISKVNQRLSTEIKGIEKMSNRCFFQFNDLVLGLVTN
jgi:hypothetical protein